MNAPLHTPPPGISAAEWQARIDLAAAYRLVARRGWDDLIYTHVSARHPELENAFLINRFGLCFAEVTASNLLVIDGSGQVIGDQQYRANPAGFAIHAAVHAAREDAHCVMHLHTDAGIAVSMLDCGLLPLSQHAMRFWKSIGYHDYEGIALTPSEATRLVDNLGKHPALILRNHGTMTVGRTVAEAYVLMDTLEKSCRTQLAAMAASPGGLKLPSEAVLDHTLAQLTGDWEPEGELEWPALLRMLEREEPDFLN
ncbi:MAG: class II aldolase/adducin family protein [Pseudazoarcus pumilus]|nr:class II aldolase/adducin family protein [Pseudazoarcus pumilus]